MTFFWPLDFYPRPPRGGRLKESQEATSVKHFYPRPPRGGRPMIYGISSIFRDFYPRPPRGGRPIWARTWTTPRNFYPRPPRGGRRFFQTCTALTCRFLSTPSARRATGRWRGQGQAGAISIHALREEGDQVGVQCHLVWSDFYPRPPRGGRRFLTCKVYNMHKFLSTPSARRATEQRHHSSYQRPISIHALREEGD